MKKSIIFGTLSLLPALAIAQSPVDAMSLSQSELRGTARFMSMAGAFTALGGDLSTLNQNPAGIGIYRGNDVGFTFDVNMMNGKSSGISNPVSSSQTHFDVNNFGYIGTLNVGGQTFQTISFGASYSRVNSFNRQYRGGINNLQTSLSNYIAGLTNGVNPDDLKFFDNQDPYNNWSKDAPDWMSILFYNSGMINPELGQDELGIFETSDYRGMWHYGNDRQYNGELLPGTSGSADFFIKEQGYVDEYSINFGGNLANTVYWGLGIGITDLDFSQEMLYTETLRDAQVPASPVGSVPGDAEYADLGTWKKVSGTGINLKLGLILKPINEFRVGLAVHTPTWYSMSSSSYGFTDVDFTSGFYGSETAPYDDYDFHLQTPWRLMAGVAGVIGGRGIISLDYEYEAYDNMKLSDYDGNSIEYANNLVKDYYQGTSTIRLGGEYRVTPQFSVRAGYSYKASDSKNILKDNKTEISTAGFNTSYTVADNTQYITAGMGYRTGGFYIDMAYVHKHRSATYHCFTSFTDYDGKWKTAPEAKITDNNSQLVFTLGYKF